jgi:hypothetical protein
MTIWKLTLTAMFAVGIGWVAFTIYASIAIGKPNDAARSGEMPSPQFRVARSS